MTEEQATINTDPLGDEGVDDYEPETLDSPELEAGPPTEEVPAEDEVPSSDDPLPEQGNTEPWVAAWEEADEETRRELYAKEYEHRNNLYAAMREERTSRQRLEGRFAQFLETLGMEAESTVQRHAEEAEEEAPKREEDPIGYLEHAIYKKLTDELDRRDMTAEQRRAAELQASQQAQAEAAIQHASQSAQDEFRALEADGAPVRDAIAAVANAEFEAAATFLSREYPQASREQVAAAAQQHVEKIRYGWLQEYAGRYDELGIELIRRAADMGAVDIGEPATDEPPEPRRTGRMESVARNVGRAQAPAGRPSAPPRSSVRDVREAMKLPDDEYEQWIEAQAQQAGVTVSEMIERTSRQMAHHV